MRLLQSILLVGAFATAQCGIIQEADDGNLREQHTRKPKTKSTELIPGQASSSSSLSTKGSVAKLPPTARRYLSKSRKSSNEYLFCQNTPEENDVLARLFVAPRYNVSSFLDEHGDAIPDVASFVESIRQAIGDDDLAKIYSDKMLLESAMAPNMPLPTIKYSLGLEESGTRRLEDCVDSVRCAALIADVIAKGFDLSFGLVGLGGLSGALGTAAGKKLAQRLLASPQGSRLIKNIANIVNTGGDNTVKVVSNTVAAIVNEVGVNNMMGALTESADLSFLDYLKIAATFAAETAAIFATSGASLALKITKAGVSAVGLYNAIKAVEGCNENCTDEPTPLPTPLPTTLKPTNEPTERLTTREPTPRPTRKPTKPPGRKSGVFGDPHLSTFDRLRFDCQAAGEFVTSTSLEDPSFQIQERFTAVGSNVCSQASVSTGVVIRDTTGPSIQISTPRNSTASTGLNKIGACLIDFYVDGVVTLFGSALASGEVEVVLSGSRVSINNVQTSVSVDITVRHSSSFGCHFSVQVFMPTAYRSNETILGLLGTPNGQRSDDWRAPDGGIITAPSTEEESIFSTSYNYCVDNWCIKDENDSIFTYTDGESFDDINRCDEDYASDIEEAVANASEALVNICGAKVFCLVDGLCGDLTDALNALQDDEDIEADQEDTDPTPTTAPSISSSPSEPPSQSPSASNVPSYSAGPSVSTDPSTSQSPSATNMPSYSTRPSSVPSYSAGPSVSTNPSASQSPSATNMPSYSTRPSNPGSKAGKGSKSTIFN